MLRLPRYGSASRRIVDELLSSGAALARGKKPASTVLRQRISFEEEAYRFSIRLLYLEKRGLIVMQREAGHIVAIDLSEAARSQLPIVEWVET